MNLLIKHKDSRTRVGWQKQRYEVIVYVVRVGTRNGGELAPDQLKVVL